MKRFLAIATLAASLGVGGQAAAQDVLPRPEPRFDGVIGLDWRDSVPSKFPITHAPKGAPNILVVLIDDCGFAQWGTFGGQVPTPTLDRVAANGLRYNRFHTTALCSPTRAALLTGRNHHAAATGVITEMGTSFPGYSGRIPEDTALISETLRQSGYSTAFYGKNHNIPDWETSVAGPYDRWPSLQGFDHFFGFVGGEANQWQPALYRDNTPVEMQVPKGREGDYTLNDALADEAISFVRSEKSVTPDRPFFIYYAPGATHAPHHVPKAWLDRFGGKFDQGWDRYREEAYRRQLKLGVIPPGTKLTPRPKQIPAWESLSADERKVASRLMEAFAAYTAQTDHEVGRLIDAIDNVGQLDNTLIFFAIGDNGASMEGTPTGVFNEMTVLNGVKEDTSYLVQHLDEIGGPRAYNHFPVGWAWAMNTPFQWGKQIASHLGGTRNPLVVSWPRRIKDKGTVRTQFHHVIDIAPTILEAAGLPEPVSVNGVWQRPIDGRSMVYSFDQAGAKSPRRTQYFEMFANRALYHDGWVAAAFHGRAPWAITPPHPYSEDRWELYNLDADFSEAHDVAAAHPDKLAELQNLFWVEAAKNNVLPLDDRLIARGDPAARPSLIAGRTTFTYFGGVDRIPEGSAANVKNRSHTITADVTVPSEGASGVLVAAGGVVGGYALYLQDSRPVYEYNWFAQKRFKITAADKVPAGRHTIRFEFKTDGGLGAGGAGTLLVDGKKVARGEIPMTIPGRYSADETFDTGRDTGSPVGAYEAPFAFTGALAKVVIDNHPARLSRHDVEALGRMRRATAAAIE